MRLESDLRNVAELEEGRHCNCDLSDPDLSLTHFFLISFIYEEVDSISIWTEIPKFVTKYVNLCSNHPHFPKPSPGSRIPRSLRFEDSLYCHTRPRGEPRREAS